VSKTVGVAFGRDRPGENVDYRDQGGMLRESWRCALRSRVSENASVERMTRATEVSATA
jgi:hypothetical protein